MKIDYEAKTKTEGRLVNAFQRLVDRKPLRTKASGILSLNKINVEASLGNSYVHKFKDFVKYAKPIIQQYNKDREKAIESGITIEVESKEPVSEVDSLKAKLEKSNKLKADYRAQLENSIKARKLLETENSRLMFRVFELQQEILDSKETVVPFGR